MAMKAITPWIELVSLHFDVLSEGFSQDIFALDLGPLADGRVGRLLSTSGTHQSSGRKPSGVMTQEVRRLAPTALTRRTHSAESLAGRTPPDKAAAAAPNPSVQTPQ